jgi:drug/metabolite transporter (DMT)-like permease
VSARIIGVFLVLLSVSIEAFGQIALKKAAVSEGGADFRLWNWLGIGLIGAEALVWTLVLGLLDVSIAFPMGALSFATTAIFSKVILKERIDPGRWCGILVIIVGTVFLAMS